MDEDESLPPEEPSDQRRQPWLAGPILISLGFLPAIFIMVSIAASGARSYADIESPVGRAFVNAASYGGPVYLFFWSAAYLRPRGWKSWANAIVLAAGVSLVNVVLGIAGGCSYCRLGH